MDDLHVNIVQDREIGDKKEGHAQDLEYFLKQTQRIGVLEKVVGDNHTSEKHRGHQKHEHEIAVLEDLFAVPADGDGPDHAEGGQDPFVERMSALPPAEQTEDAAPDPLMDYKVFIQTKIEKTQRRKQPEVPAFITVDNLVMEKIDQGRDQRRPGQEQRGKEGKELVLLKIMHRAIVIKTRGGGPQKKPDADTQRRQNKLMRCLDETPPDSVVCIP